jgi:membrane protease YdiL (CAAX protease family)
LFGNGRNLGFQQFEYKCGLRLALLDLGPFMKEPVKDPSSPGVDTITSEIVEIDHAASSQPRILGFWKTLAWGIPLTLTMIVFQTIGLVGFLGLWRYLHPRNPIPLKNAATNGAVLASSLAVAAPAVILLLVWIVRQTKVPLNDYLALKWPSGRELAIGFVGLAIVLGVTSLIATALGEETPAFISDTFTTAQAAGMLPLLLISFVFLGPLQEELVFRGFFFRGMAPSIGNWPAILLTAVVWAVSHGQYQWFFIGEIFALGVLFGWLRCRSGSTILSLILHAAVNGMAVVSAAAGVS